MHYPWLTHYPKNVPAKINFTEFQNLNQFFKYSCKKYADKIAFTSFNVDLSYQQLDQLSDHFASYLQQLNLAKGTRIALMLPNILQYPVCMIGILKAGHIVTSCNPLYTSSELTHQLNDSKAEAIVVVENFAATLQQTLVKTPHLKHIITTQIGDLLSWKKGLINFALKYVKKQIPKWQIPHTISFPESLKIGSQHKPQKVEVSAQDIAFLQYTGGTTGKAKGAMLSHQNLIANLAQAHAWLKPYTSGKNDIIVTALPLYHIFALTANCLTFIKLGSQNLLIPDPRNFKAFINTLKKHPFTAFTGVNTLFNALLNQKKFKTIDFSHLKFVLGGGMAVQQSVAEQWYKTTGVKIKQAYGLTETSPAVSINPFDSDLFPNSIGLPLPSTQVTIRDGNNDLAFSQIGEIRVKGPQVMKGYWNNPQETQEVFDKDGFLHTGDIGYMNEQGYIFLVDRKKDLIIVSGFNVYPNEIEDLVATHPDVQEVAAVGIDTPIVGEKIKLYIVPKNNDLTKQEILAHCKKSLTKYKIPSEIEFCSSLPKSNIGKILRRKLREQANQKNTE